MKIKLYATMLSRLVVVWVIALSLLLSPSAAKAQDTLTGALGGVVVNKRLGTPIKEAIVQIISEETKFTIRVSTDEQGRFYKGLLTPGVYTLNFSASGFEPSEVKQRVFVNQVNQVVPIPVELSRAEGKIPKTPRPSTTPNSPPSPKISPPTRPSSSPRSAPMRKSPIVGGIIGAILAPSYGGLAVAALPKAAIFVEPTNTGESVRGVIPSDQILFVFNDLPPRPYRVKVTLDGYQLAEKEVVVSARKTLGVTFNLEPEKSSSVVDTVAKFHALVIGNNGYQNLPRLKTAENDAKAVEAVLREQYGFQTKLILNATREQIVVALNEYRRQLDQDANLLIYYAGHGYNDTEIERAYWLPVDARKEDNANWISADDITQNIRAIPAKHILIVSDSCYSGTIMRGLETNIAEPIVRDRYLQKMSGGKSRTLMASGGNEPVADGGGQGHSVFARALMNGLEQMDKDVFTAEEVYYNFIREAVTGKSNQTPEYNSLRNSGHESGDFVFVRNRK